MNGLGRPRFRKGQVVQVVDSRGHAATAVVRSPAGGGYGGRRVHVEITAPGATGWPVGYGAWWPTGDIREPRGQLALSGLFDDA